MVSLVFSFETIAITLHITFNSTFHFICVCVHSTVALFVVVAAHCYKWACSKMDYYVIEFYHISIYIYVVHMYLYMHVHVHIVRNFNRRTQYSSDVPAMKVRQRLVWICVVIYMHVNMNWVLSMFTCVIIMMTFASTSLHHVMPREFRSFVCTVHMPQGKAGNILHMERANSKLWQKQNRRTIGQTS